MATKAEQIAAEFRRLHAQFSVNGKLDMKAVEKYLRGHKSNIIAKELEFDDRKCGILYRIEQLRTLIRVYYVVEPQSGFSVPEFSTDKAERTQGGGYRKTTELLADDVFRQNLIDEYLDGLTGHYKRFRGLTELRPVAEAVERLVADYRRMAGAAAAV